jgi:hypothetical protein
MLKRVYILFFCIVIYSGKVWATVNPDSLLRILQVKDKSQQEGQLVKYIKDNFINCPVADLNSAKTNINNFLLKYNVENEAAFAFFAESMYQRRLSQITESENAMVKAIQSADKNGDSFLSYTFLSYLASVQTSEGNVIGAVTSYRMANKDAIRLDDTNLQMIIDISISDVYYRYGFYSQSLFYLDQAQAIGAKFWPDDQRVKNTIYYNKAENFFMMDRIDSLQFYNEKLKSSTANTYKLYTYKNRTDYYVSMLRRDYKGAIKLIHAMHNDGGYIFDEGDLQNLAEAFYKDGQADSAKLVINQLLFQPSAVNHPEINDHLYAVLGKIAEEQHDYKLAYGYFKLSMRQAEVNRNKLTQVGNISALIKADDIEGYYSQKSATYKRERLWLIAAIIFALLMIFVIAMLYRAIRQKRHYEQLLFTAKKEELSFINSHDVRKHLTNIMGLITVIEQSDDKEKAYQEAEDHLFTAAQHLDQSIKNISEKLDN